MKTSRFSTKIQFLALIMQCKKFCLITAAIEIFQMSVGVTEAFMTATEKQEVVLLLPVRNTVLLVYGAMEMNI